MAGSTVGHIFLSLVFQLMPIYAMSHEMERVRKAFKWLCDKVDGENEKDQVRIEFTFYDLPFFFWRLVEVAPLEYPKKVSISSTVKTI